LIRYLVLGALIVGCGGSQSPTRSATERNTCPIDPDEPGIVFLPERAVLPDGAACLEFPLRQADRLSLWFRDARHMFLPGNHSGIDIPVPVGTIVVAPASGTVTHAKASRTDTNTVRLDLGDGWEASFSHLRLISVEVGQDVVQGQVIGLSGGQPGDPGAGPCTTGPHLHYALMKDRKHADPLAYSCLR